MTQKNATVTLNMDWKALREQKQIIIQLADLGAGDEIEDNLNGILHLIDYIQDEAAEQIGSRTVFGK